MHQTGQKRHLIFPVLLKLLLKVCIIVANDVCLKHTHSFLYYCLVQYTSEREVNTRFLLFQKKKQEAPFCKSCYIKQKKIEVSMFSLFDVFILNSSDCKSDQKQVDFNVFLEIFFFIFVSEERQTQYYNWVIFPPLRDSGLIATLHKSFCHYLCYIILACLGMPCS